MGDGERLLSASEREYFFHFEQMFASQGWKQLCGELDDDIRDLPERMFTNATSFEELQIARKCMDKVKEVLAYPDIIQSRKEQAVTLLEMERDQQNEAGSTYGE